MRFTIVTTVLLVVVTSLYHTHAYSHYRDRIPNGHAIEHPCKSGYMWYGIGHQNFKGSGVRNQFGIDFQNYGHVWGTCLCQLDSDGDGRTNGEELGDPECAWKPGQTPKRITNLSHPGICEPITDPKCQKYNRFLDCTMDGDFQCDAIKSADVENVTLRLTQTKVPRHETTYICQAYNISKDIDADVQMIAVTPEIDNENVIHHILLYGCDAHLESVAMNKFGEPGFCLGMVLCVRLINVWTVGTSGICLDDALGFRLGTHGFKVVVMELHWNNPENKIDYTDSSGLTLHYTENKRPNDAGIVMVGPALLHIPPAYNYYEVNGSCVAECTNKFFPGSSINIAYLNPHMHYLGANFSAQHIRGTQVLNKADMATYIYDSPEMLHFSKPWQVQAGDTLNVTCGFNSVTKNKGTFWGYETSEEMCFAIFIYYPAKPNMEIFCQATDNFGYCGGYDVSDDKKFGLPDNYCSSSLFGEVIKLSREIANNNTCDENGLICKPGCEEAMLPIRNHTCLAGSQITYARDVLQYKNGGQLLLNMLDSCVTRPEIIEDSKPKQVTCKAFSNGCSLYIILMAMIVYKLL